MSGVIIKIARETSKNPSHTVGSTGKWCTFSRITLLSLVRFVSINLVLSTKNMFMVFDQIMSLTKAGYTISRNIARHKGVNFGYLYIVSGMFVPFAILMMPLVKETAKLGIDNIFGAVILYLVFYMPMDVMLYSGYLKNVPPAMEEAAYIDGASTWKTYLTIIFPMMKPMHATVAVLTVLGAWNDVMTPLVIMSGSESTTLPLAQLNFQTQFGTNYNLAFASYLLALIPILVFYVLCQKQIIGGIANGAVKG